MGVCFAWCAEARLRAEGIWCQPPLTLVASYLAIVLVPACTYLYLAHPDWMWHYLLDGERVPRLAVVPFLAAIGGFMLAGYWGATRLAARAGVRALVPAVIASGGLVLVLLVALRRRLGAYGDYFAYHNGTAPGLGEVKLGYALVALVLGVLAAGVYVGLVLRADGKKVRER